MVVRRADICLIFLSLARRFGQLTIETWSSVPARGRLFAGWFYALMFSPSRSRAALGSVRFGFSTWPPLRGVFSCADVSSSSRSHAALGSVRSRRAPALGRLFTVWFRALTFHLRLNLAPPRAAYDRQDDRDALRFLARGRLFAGWFHALTLHLLAPAPPLAAYDRDALFVFQHVAAFFVGWFHALNFHLLLARSPLWAAYDRDTLFGFSTWPLLCGCFHALMFHLLHARVPLWAAYDRVTLQHVAAS